jgi:hypothetical protein
MSNTTRTWPEAHALRYELCYRHLFEAGHGFVFPRDAHGHVAIGELSDRARRSDRDTATRAGIEYGWPQVERRSQEVRP